LAETQAIARRGLKRIVAHFHPSLIGIVIGKCGSATVQERKPQQSASPKADLI